MVRKDKLVWAEFGTAACIVAVRIFKNAKQAANASVAGRFTRRIYQRLAVSDIRRQVFHRDDFRCRRCGLAVRWETGEMDEIVSKGSGGEVSVENCQVLCCICHDDKHGRRPRFGESSVQVSPRRYGIAG